MHLQAATPASVETPTKSSGNTVQGLVKKLKGFDGLAMSIGNGNAEPVDGGTDHGLSQRSGSPTLFLIHMYHF